MKMSENKVRKLNKRELRLGFTCAFCERKAVARRGEFGEGTVVCEYCAAHAGDCKFCIYEDHDDNREACVHCGDPFWCGDTGTFWSPDIGQGNEECVLLIQWDECYKTGKEFLHVDIWEKGELGHPGGDPNSGSGTGVDPTARQLWERMKAQVDTESHRVTSAQIKEIWAPMGMSVDMLQDATEYAGIGHARISLSYLEGVPEHARFGTLANPMNQLRRNGSQNVVSKLYRSAKYVRLGAVIEGIYSLRVVIVLLYHYGCALPTCPARDGRFDGHHAVDPPPSGANARTNALTRIHRI